MTKLIDLSTGETLLTMSQAIKLGGPYQWGLEEGRYAWLDVPPGEDPEDCVLDTSTGAPQLVVDSAVKDSRLSQVQAETDRKAQLKTLRQALKALAQKTALTNAELQEFVLKLGKTLLLNRELD